MPYTFRVVFSGLCYHHTNLEKGTKGNGARSPAKNGFDPAVLLVNATVPRTSIDGITHLHRHEPTMTFDPADLDDYSVDVGSFETDFRLIPTGGQRQESKRRFQDSLAMLDLRNKEIRLELEEEDAASRRLEIEHKIDTDLQVPESQEQDEDFRWVPRLTEIDRRIHGLKKQCFDPLLHNAFVACRFNLHYGRLRVGRIGRDLNDDHLLWDFVPNAYPGRKNGHSSTSGEDDPRHWSQVQQALADQVVLELTELRHPIRVRYKEGQRTGTLTFFHIPVKGLKPEVTIHVANLPSLPDLPDTDVVTHFRWFYELVEWKNGLPSDLPAPRPANRGLGVFAGGNALCPHGGG